MRPCHQAGDPLRRRHIQSQETQPSTMASSCRHRKQSERRLSDMVSQVTQACRHQDSPKLKILPATCNHPSRGRIRLLSKVPGVLRSVCRRSPRQGLQKSDEVQQRCSSVLEVQEQIEMESPRSSGTGTRGVCVPSSRLEERWWNEPSSSRFWPRKTGAGHASASD